MFGLLAGIADSVGLDRLFRPQRAYLQRARAAQQDERSLVDLQPECPAERDPRALLEGCVHGDLRIRPVRTDEEIAAVADLQASSFQEPVWGPAFLESAALQSLRAEAMSTLQHAIKFCPRDAFCCLIAEAPEPSDSGASVAGVGHVAIAADPSVLKVIDLPSEPIADVGAGRPPFTQQTTYAYVSSMAVAENMRRKGLGSALLGALARVARCWGYREVYLHVYEDNEPAVKMYKACGFRVAYRGRPGGLLPGGRVKLLMRAVVGPDGSLTAPAEGDAADEA
ncbi:unnamed protein product [Pedinophyceae sp. YPF-701]|nr:unnamed protein product [Pedinophyceae sp. YPF-701]